MTSTTLFREGLDLDDLLAELDAEHDGRVRVVDVEYGRDGGVMGFFAKRTVGVHYVVSDVSSDDDLPAAPVNPYGGSPLDAMLRAAEAAEASAFAADGRGAVDSFVPAPVTTPVATAESLLAAEAVVASGSAAAADAPGDNVEFARMLLEIAAQKNADRQSDAIATPAELPVVTDLPSAIERPVFPIATPAAPIIPTPPAPVAAAPAMPIAAPPATPIARPIPVAPMATPAAPTVAVPTVPPLVTSADAPAASEAPPLRVTALAGTHLPDFVSAFGPAAARADMLELVRTRPVGAHRAAAAAAAEAVAAPVTAVPVTAASLTATEPAIELPAAVQPAPVAAGPIAAGPIAAGPIAAGPILTGPILTEPIIAAPTAPAVPVPAPITTADHRLADLGVPAAWLATVAGSGFAAVEQIIGRLPAVIRPELEPGQILVVAGPAAQATAEATRLAAQLRLDSASIRTAGFGANPIRNRRAALALELDVRGTRGEPCVVVVATDSTGDAGGLDDLAWAAEIVAALAPDQLVLVADATSHPADVRRSATTLGGVSALAVVKAARAARPAAVWELGVQVVSLDGVAATRGGWAALLIDRLGEAG